MKTTFYVRLFLTFILFATLLLLFSLFSFDNFFRTNIKDIEIQKVKKTFLIQEQLINSYIQEKNNKLKAIKQSDIFNKYLKTENEKILLDYFKIIMSSNKDILEMKFLDFKGVELFRVNNNDSSLEVVKKHHLQDLSANSCFKNLRVLKDDKIWNSNISLYKDKGEISFPTKDILKFAIKTKKGFIVIISDVKATLKKLENLVDGFVYVVDKNGYFISHKHSKFNWSKFFAPNKTLFKEYPKYAHDILSSNEFISEDLISKRLYINKEKYVVTFMVFKNKGLENSSLDFENYFNSILIVGLILAIFLAILFSEPIAKLNKKILDRNKDLDLNIKKNNLQLNESLEILDKYVMSIRLDKEGVITDVSSALCDSTGFLKEELIGHYHKILVHPEYVNDEYYKMWDYVRSGNSHNYEIKCIKKDGSFFWSESYIEANFTDDDEIIGFTIIRNNITDKKTIQKLYNNINNKVSQYNAIFENVNSGIALVCIDGNFKKVNSKIIDLLGYSENELLKMSCFDIITKNSEYILRKFFNKAVEIGSISEVEKIFIHKDERQIHLEMSLSLLNDKKHFVFVVNSLEDKRKLQELNQNLSSKINDEVEKSRQKDKIHQEEQIKNIKLSSIGSLAAGITHEINTPLTYIKGNFEMMTYDIEDLPPSKLRARMLEDSVKINEGLNRIANIVESMREISQTSKENKEEINIYSTLITTLTMAYNRSKQISRIYLNGKLFTIESLNKNEFEFICTVQKQRIEQVWIVIINNALDELVKISDYENREFNIDIKQDEKNIIVSFSDNAGGISEDIIDNIFDPFVSSKEYSGMGVGLNIAKKIIEQQNGEIKAFNKNSGAVFEIKLKKTIILE